MTVCKVGPTGKTSQLWSFTIDAGDDNDGRTWEKSFKDLDGYVLSVHLDCKSVTKKFEYELKATTSDKPIASRSVSSK